jgi:pimeloyl-ACP methyl ester carboxylesterase
MEVDPRWLVKMLGLTIIGALLCGYLTLCGLFYQGQWQFVLHPNAGSSSTPATLGLPFQDVHFHYTETGQPQLHGWWIPADKGARHAQDTVLYLHGGDGSLSGTLPRLKELHDAGLNVFAFDYRGYGQKTSDQPADPHPNERRMTEDTTAAWLYVTQTRSIPETQIIPCGQGVGGSLAVQLVTDHPGIPAFILEDPVYDTVSQVRQDPRATLIPVRLLFHERFEIAKPLATLQTPKLIVRPNGLSVADAASARAQSLSRFLDEYLPSPAATQR